MKELNRGIECSNEELDVVIEEMVSREEFLCTGQGCVGHAQGL